MASKRRTLGEINVVCCGLRAAFLSAPHRGKSLLPKRRRKTGGAVEVQAQGIKIIINYVHVNVDVDVAETQKSEKIDHEQQQQQQQQQQCSLGDRPTDNKMGLIHSNRIHGE
ncbi:hypothetical protein H0E87_015990 [Populus deltoides]|uniref:Uncharacterized protein n=1 Tax=Populus deltoides TaxID=3696 RepID=A0A8T2Y7D6_POPDE|nr:hypothetical protein H0E87_015990 [Populus deltoides]